VALRLRPASIDRIGQEKLIAKNNQDNKPYSTFRQQGDIMTFTQSIQLCFSKYADFNGRAKRPEYWWFFLFLFLLGAVTGAISEVLNGIVALATLIPSLAVGARRLHDTDRSGWWQLLWIIPVIGWIVVIIFLAEEGKSTDNQFGAMPSD
jgi:uncharacterized membrane protein YhaH (DUF805 family)